MSFNGWNEWQQNGKKEYKHENGRHSIFNTLYEEQTNIEWTLGWAGLGCARNNTSKRKNEKENIMHRNFIEMKSGERKWNG